MTSNPVSTSSVDKIAIDDIDGLPTALLDAIPNPVLVKDEETRYVWVNAAFETLFEVRRQDLVGELDADLFPDRQAAQCNGGDLRVLATGEVDEAEETVVDPTLGDRITITRKSRLTVDGKNYLVGVMHDITDVTEANRQLAVVNRKLDEQAVELARLASTDPLTGCLNRRALFTQVNKLPSDRQVGVIVLDLDHFKSINDQYGHDTGDTVLSNFATMIRKILRTDEIFARTGGEEFVIVLPGASLDQTRQLAQRICTAVSSNPMTVGEQTLRVTVSAGATYGTSLDEAPIGDLVNDADTLLYKAKEGGRNRAVTV